MSLRERWKVFTFEDLNRRFLGVLALIGCGIAIVAVAFIAVSGVFEDRIPMTATFTDVTGLKVGSSVTVAGVDVGEVTGIDPDFEQGNVLVSLEIDRVVELGPQTRAELASETLFGGQQIRLSGPVVEPYLEAGHHIDVSLTRRAVDVVQAIDNATQTIEDIDVDTVNLVAGDLADLAASTRGQLDGLFVQIEKVAATLASREEQLGHLLDNAQQVTATLTEKDQQIFALLDGASALLDELAAREAQLRGLLGDGTDALEDLSTFIRDHREQLETLTADLGTTLGSVTGELDDLDRTLAFLGPTFAALPETRGQGPWIDFLLVTVGDPGGAS